MHDTAEWNQRYSTVKCLHGFNKKDKICVEFVNAFKDAFKCEADKYDAAGIPSWHPSCLLEAESATMDKYAEVWNDSAKIEIAINCLLSTGVQNIMLGYNNGALNDATLARYLEQHIAVALKETQANVNWPKLHELGAWTRLGADIHTLVKFLRKRIPCKCLDEKYQQVKSITKMGFCDGPQCRFPRVDRSKTFYCSRCRGVTYCSRKCQEADWTEHQVTCDKADAVKAKFDAKQLDRHHMTYCDEFAVVKADFDASKSHNAQRLGKAHIDLGKKVRYEAEL